MSALSHRCRRNWPGSIRILRWRLRGIHGPRGRRPHTPIPRKTLRRTCRGRTGSWGLRKRNSPRRYRNRTRPYWSSRRVFLRPPSSWLWRWRRIRDGILRGSSNLRTSRILSMSGCPSRRTGTSYRRSIPRRSRGTCRRRS